MCSGFLVSVKESRNATVLLAYGCDGDGYGPHPQDWFWTGFDYYTIVHHTTVTQPMDTDQIKPNKEQNCLNRTIGSPCLQGNWRRGEKTVRYQPKLGVWTQCVCFSHDQPLLYPSGQSHVSVFTNATEGFSFSCKFRKAEPRATTGCSCGRPRALCRPHLSIEISSRDNGRHILLIL